MLLVLVPTPGPAQGQVRVPAESVAHRLSGDTPGDPGWVAEAILAQPSDVSYWSSFGAQVARSGDTVLVGAPGRWNANHQISTVYFYSRSGASWTLDHRVSYDAVVAGIALSPDYAFLNFGANVVIYTRRGASWEVVQALDVPNGSGGAMAVSEGTLVIGAAGHAFVFESAGDGFRSQQVLEPPGGMQATFGASVGISGDTVLVGQPSFDTVHPGKAWAFRRIGETWIEEAELLPGRAEPTHGYTVAVDGDLAAVGTASATAGVSVYSRSGGIWSLPETLSFSAPLGLGDLGSIGLAGDTLVVARPSLRSSGWANIRVREGGAWVRKADLVPPEGPLYGTVAAISVEKKTGAILLGFHDDTRAQGVVYLFEPRDSGNAPLWQQNDNVPFGQSRNVPLTTSCCEDAGRTTTDDPSRS